jgi:hypothetical protein
MKSAIYNKPHKSCIHESAYKDHKHSYTCYFTFSAKTYLFNYLHIDDFEHVINENSDKRRRQFNCLLTL